ncbi:hypothetical protein [Limnospira fusiformis]|uniref:hypothetical protein n=1 Tax=Limnospira fusiformis TaxID=54297 RepID=UPI001448FC9A|nr:hypothetical protein HFV01_03230 [Limnospira fusiformis SAG 85.79]
MLWVNKKLTQSVTFTEDAADQTLLEAIEKELSLTKYQTFSNLCKQALWQFLLSSPTTQTPVVNNDYRSEITSERPVNPPPNLKPIEEGLLSLQRQLGVLERQLQAQKTENQTQQLESQVNQLTQQLAQFQSAIASKLDATNEAIAQIPSQLPQITSPPPPPEPPRSTAPSPPPPEPVHPQEADPLLQRLSSLVDDF